jgi:hypothetical protein
MCEVLWGPNKVLGYCTSAASGRAFGGVSPPLRLGSLSQGQYQAASGFATAGCLAQIEPGGLAINALETPFETAIDNQAAPVRGLALMAWRAEH